MQHHHLKIRITFSQKHGTKVEKIIQIKIFSYDFITLDLWTHLTQDPLNFILGK